MAKGIPPMKDKPGSGLCAVTESERVNPGRPHSHDAQQRAQTSVLPKERAGSHRQQGRAGGARGRETRRRAGSRFEVQTTAAQAPWVLSPLALSRLSQSPCFTDTCEPRSAGPSAPRNILSTASRPPLTHRSDLGLHLQKPSCGFPVALRIKPKMPAVTHEALLHPAPGTAPRRAPQAGAPPVRKTSGQPRRAPRLQLQSRPRDTLPGPPHPVQGRPSHCLSQLWSSHPSQD